MRDCLTETAQAWTDAVFRWFRPEEERARTERLQRSLRSLGPALARSAPRTFFNGPIGGRRAFARVKLSFSEIRQIRALLGGTVNDVVLAVISGALGRFLRLHGQPTAGVELRALCPVSMRRPEEHGALGNLVSIMVVPLYVGIDDPVARLKAERAAMEQLKAEDQAGGLYALSEFVNLLPPVWQALSAQADAPNTLLNTVSTNVPGPQIPLYLAGRRLLSWAPLGRLGTGIGLFNAILSYNQTLTIGATVGPALVPDVWTYADCLKDAFAGCSPRPLPQADAPACTLASRDVWRRYRGLADAIVGGNAP